MPIVTMTLPVNVFLTALFTKGLDLSKTAIGFITALPFVCNFLQLAVTPVLSRWRPSKEITVMAATLHLASWAVLGVMLGSMPRDDPAMAARRLAWWFFISSFFASIAGVSWNSWIQEWVPARVRGKFFGRRNRALQFSTLLFLLAAGWVLAKGDYALPAFQAVIAAAVVLRIFSLHWQWVSPTPAPARHRVAPLALARQLSILRGARAFLVFIAFGAVWSFATNCFGPFYHVFLFNRLDMSAFDVGVLSTLAALGGALSMPAWGQLLDRHGNKAVMTVSLVLWQGQNFLWCFLALENRDLVYFMWAWGGMTSAGFVLGQFTLLLKLIPPEAKNLAIGVNLAIISLVAAIAPVSGGAVLDWALARHPGNPLGVYHACFILQPVLSILGAFLLLRVPEPRATDLAVVVGAMRNIRTLSGIFGLSFLSNYLFYRAPKR